MHKIVYQIDNGWIQYPVKYRTCDFLWNVSAFVLVAFVVMTSFWIRQKKRLCQSITMLMMTFLFRFLFIFLRWYRIWVKFEQLKNWKSLQIILTYLVYTYDALKSYDVRYPKTSIATQRAKNTSHPFSGNFRSSGKISKRELFLSELHISFFHIY